VLDGRYPTSKRDEQPHHQLVFSHRLGRQRSSPWNYADEPTRYERIVNLKTARALGPTILQSVLLTAEELAQ
jgi:hypothetical protein